MSGFFILTIDIHNGEQFTVNQSKIILISRRISLEKSKSVWRTSKPANVIREEEEEKKMF
jgi:hypothetical protein